MSGCGIYSIFLTSFLAGTSIVFLRWLRELVPSLALPQELEKASWPALLQAPIAVILGIGALLICAFLLKLLLQLLEYLAYRSRDCQECGARRWSWGYTSRPGL
jgi:membrane-anchored glycerophosphoryl diester phosphodiesterase (GDPDase)